MCDGCCVLFSYITCFYVVWLCCFVLWGTWYSPARIVLRTSRAGDVMRQAKYKVMVVIAWILVLLASELSRGHFGGHGSARCFSQVLCYNKQIIIQLMDCSYVISFSRQNDWTSKRHYKALDVTVNQRLISSVGIFKEFDCKVILL